MDEIYSRVFVEGPVLGKGMGRAFAAFDARVIDGIGVDGSAWATRLISRITIWWDTWIFDGSVNLIGWLVWVLVALVVVSAIIFGGYLIYKAIAGDKHDDIMKV